MKNLLIELRKAVIATAILVLILCAVYPVTVWIISQLLFPWKANGSLISHNNVVVGSVLIAQTFSAPGYFHPRPSAAGNGYDSLLSGGSNLGPLSAKLIMQIKNNGDEYRAENRLSPGTPIPADAATSSASGLDPHISLENALLQAERVAQNRGMDKRYLVKLLQLETESRQFGIFGEPRINVLTINTKLDDRK